ncbi:MAG: hypothetical protein LJE94_08255 [Deltaproteobacteria bacterium]|jgi:hypothetical protein|nr:hypothetical protein [Deltaproteobacteria bacterium]
MKITEAMQLIDENWVQKKKGFRVCLQRREGSDWITEYSPGEKAAPLDSDVTTWRLAWKLAQSTPLRTDGPREGDMVNVFVVDQDNAPITYYSTGEKAVFNACSDLS